MKFDSMTLESGTSARSTPVHPTAEKRPCQTAESVKNVYLASGELTERRAPRDAAPESIANATTASSDGAVSGTLVPEVKRDMNTIRDRLIDGTLVPADIRKYIGTSRYK